MGVPLPRVLQATGLQQQWGAGLRSDQEEESGHPTWLFHGLLGVGSFWKPRVPSGAFLFPWEGVGYRVSPQPPCRSSLVGNDRATDRSLFPRGMWGPRSSRPLKMTWCPPWSGRAASLKITERTCGRCPSSGAPARTR